MNQVKNKLRSKINKNIFILKRQQILRKKKMLIELKSYLTLKKKLSIVYPNKSIYNSIIPLNIFQTWWTKDKLTPSMFQCINIIKDSNPRFNYHLFDDNDCREFIEKNFNSNVLNAYDTLIPGAYKADLWRYCILYKMGGIYLDIKYLPIHHFKFINLTEKEHFVLDADKQGIYNALIVAKPGNEILRRAINKVVDNVQKKFYGSDCLEPTGPKMLSSFFSYYEKNNLDMNHQVYFGDNNNRIINYNNIPIFKSYNGYLADYHHNKKTEHYSALWGQRRIYN
jgi:mannosyltransferase OCH1-like enzyme